MDLNSIKEAVRTTDREVEFKVSGHTTGWFFKLRHESSPEVQEVMRQFQSRVRELALKRKNSQYQNLVAEHENRLRVSHVAGWRWEQGDDEAAGRPAFSKKELTTVLEDAVLGYHIKTFIDEEVGSLEDFLERSASS
ncbi:MAG: hypothetical protein ACREO9_01285 [Lysobacterales bacterium]